MKNCVENLEKSLVVEKIEKGVLMIQFNHPHYNNPFSSSMRKLVTKVLLNAEENPEVRAVILTGGIDRSFSVGGDFNEAKELRGGEDVEEWIDEIVSLYTASLKLTKPSIAAIDNYAIGLGFQLALTCDWRISTERAKLIMPELKHGIACTLGQFMLEKAIGRENMLRIVYDCESIPIPKCLEYRLLNKVSSTDKLFEEAFMQAEKLAQYPRVAFKTTKQAINESYVQGIFSVAERTKLAHKETFNDGYVTKFMNKIVNK